MRLRRIFAVISWVSPRLAARILIDQFQRPGRRRSLDAVDEPLLAKARLQRLRLGAQEVQVYAWGPDDAPAILLLHGWGSHAPRWSSFVAQILAQGWRAIAFDAPAHGRSSGGRANLLAFRAALDAVVARNGPVRALIAHSFGALALATRMGEAGSPLRSTPAVLISLPRDAGYLLELYLDTIDAQPVVRSHVQRLFAKRFRVPAATFSALTGAGGIDAPVLVIHDREDEAVPHEHSVQLSALLPNGTLHLTQGYGHHRLLRDPTLIGLVVDFIRNSLSRA